MDHQSLSFESFGLDQKSIENIDHELVKCLKDYFSAVNGESDELTSGSPGIKHTPQQLLAKAYILVAENLWMLNEREQKDQKKLATCLDVLMKLDLLSQVQRNRVSELSGNAN